MIGRIALMNPKAIQTTKMPAPIPIPVFLTIDWLSSVIVSHFGSGMSDFAASPLYAPIFGCCHVVLLMSVQMPSELMIDLGHELSHEPRKLKVKVLNSNSFLSQWVSLWEQRSYRPIKLLKNNYYLGWERKIVALLKLNRTAVSVGI